MTGRRDGLLVLVLAAAGLAAAPPAKAQPPAEPPSCYVGVLASRGAVEVVARGAGVLGPLQVAVGDRVAAGQELARVASPSGRHGLDQEEARLAAARSAAKSAEVEVRRARRELERRQGAKDLFSTEQIEAAQFQLEVGLLEEEGRQAAVAEAEASLARLASEDREKVLRAPFAGTVAAVYAASGSAVESGRPIFQLLATERPVVRFAVPAGDTHRFPPGARVAAEVKNGGQEAKTAVVETVAPALDAASQLIFVEAGSPAEAWKGVPMGAVLRVSPGGHGACGDRPVTLLPNAPTRESE